MTSSFTARCGAKVENISVWRKIFLDVQTIRLNKNPRSNSTIPKAANQPMLANSARACKEPWTDGVAGEAISVYAAFNEVDEARFIVED